MNIGISQKKVARRILPNELPMLYFRMLSAICYARAIDREARLYGDNFHPHVTKLWFFRLWCMVLL